MASQRKRRSGLMEGMMGGPPTASEIERVTASAPTEATSVLSAKEIIVPPMPVVPEPPPAPEQSAATVAPESLVAPVVSEDAPLDTETLDRGSMDEIRTLMEVAARKNLVEGGSLLASDWKGREGAPAELQKIFGDREVPASVAEMYAKLKGTVKRNSYLEKVATEEAEKAAKKQVRESRRKFKRPKTGKPSATLQPTPSAPEAGQQPESNNTPSAYSGKLAELENAYHARYPDGRNIPPEISEKYSALTKAQMENMFPRDGEMAEKAAKIEAEIETLLAELSAPATPIMPKPPAVAAETQPQVPIRAVDSSEFVAPQYSPRDMQAEMDIANEPNVFRSNRAPLKNENVEEKAVVPEEVVNVAAPEGTPKEWRAKLKALIDGVKEKVSGTYEASREFLTNRNVGIAEKAKTMGKGIGELVLNIGEQYRKAPLKYKIALSVALIGGSLATGGASTFITVLSAAKLGQRSLASAGVYALVNGLMEKRLANREERGIERSRLDRAIKQLVSSGAALAVFSGIPGLAAKELLDSAGGIGGVIEYWRNVLGYHASVPEAVSAVRQVAEAQQNHITPQTTPAAASPAVVAVEHPSVSQADVRRVDIANEPRTTGFQAEVRAADTTAERAVPGEASAAAIAGEAGVAAAPAIEFSSVEAKAGDGYERMLKHLIDKLPENPPADMNPDSDLARLYEAKAHPETINAAIHTLATDNEFYKADGTNVRINIGDKLTIDAKGDIWLNDETILSPEGARVTPAIHPEVAPTHPDASFQHEATQVDSVDVGDVPTAEDQTTSVNEVPADQSLQNVEVETPVYPRVEADGLQQAAEHEVVTNQFGIPVATAEPHIYAGADDGHTFAFGGSYAERAAGILEYLKENPTKVVFGADPSGRYRIPWHLVDGEVTPAGMPVRTGGFLGTGFGSTEMKPPEPEEFKKLIK